VLLLASVLGLTASALGENDRSDPLCPHIVACQYEAPAFTIRVVDQQTGQPLADVHAIASWLVYDRRRGVLMALEAISGPDGQLAFPAWGPMRSAVAGMVEGRDPIISLFRPGYRAKLIHNATPVEQLFTARVHAFSQAGDTFELVQFQGNPDEALADLRRADDTFEGASLSQDAPISFRQAYMRRLGLIKREVERLPRAVPQVDRFLKLLNDDIRFFEAGGQ
jgi:hypothetical protein